MDSTESSGFVTKLNDRIKLFQIQWNDDLNSIFHLKGENMKFSQVSSEKNDCINLFFVNSE